MTDTNWAEDIWKKITHIRCMMCNAQFDVQQDQGIVKDADDLDMYYDVFDCCDDPFYVGQIITQTPLFTEGPEVEVNAEYWIEMKDKHEYELDDNFFDRLTELKEKAGG